MSNIGNVQSNPLYQPTHANTASTVTAAASFANHTVQVAATAQQPAQPSGIGDTIKGFFGSIKEAFQDLGRKITDATTFKPLANKMFNTPEAQFSAAGMSNSNRLAGAYAFVKDAADGITPTTIGAFMRSNSNGSKLTTFAAVKPETDAVMQSVRTVVGENMVGIDKKSYGLDSSGTTNRAMSPFTRVRNAESDNAVNVQQLAQASVDKIDDVMCEIFGTPGNQASIDAAAARFPQSLCDQLAVISHAVDNSAAPANLKDGMKLHLARDALALRSVNPAIAKIVGSSDRTDGTTSLLQVSKAVQSLVNGVGLGIKDTHPEVVQAGQHMQGRWDNAFSDFVDAIMARADPNIVASAENRGQRTLDARV